MFVVIALVFGVLAALMAFLITYGEYTHHYSGTKEPLRMALEAAVFAFLVFIILGILAGVLLSRML